MHARATLTVIIMAIGTLRGSGLTSSCVYNPTEHLKLQNPLDCMSASSVFIPEGKVGWIKIRQQHSIATAQTVTHKKEGLT